MAGGFPARWLDELYARADIVQVVSAYLPLRKRGGRYMGLCPFHSEKTPSFSVNAELNVYHCFGCKAGGNVVQFVMEMERLSYQEALLHLAGLFHLPPPPERDDPQARRRQDLLERLYEANKEAALYYHRCLFSQAGAPALEYLKRRGFEDAAIRRFGLGAGGEEWDALGRHLTELGFSIEEQTQAGLVHDREKSRYDVFRGRLMFPIIDLFGRTAGFGARAMGQAQPKYLNTADTQVFNKRRTLYGIHLLRRRRDLKALILVEGYMDVLALDQAGIPGAVATLGTSLTPEQARLMKRFAPEVLISYDGDEPGQAAALRAIEVFEREEIPARVLFCPGGQDPDELVREGGAEAFLALKPLSPLAFRLMRAEKAYDLSAQEGRSGFAREAAALIAASADPIEAELSLKALALKTGFSLETLTEQAAGLRRPRPGGPRPPPARPRPRGREPGPPPEEKAEKNLLALLANGYLPTGSVAGEDFDSPFLKALAVRLLAGERPAALLEGMEEGPERETAVELFASPPPVERDLAEAAAAECRRALQERRLRKRIEERKAQMEGLSGAEKEAALKEVLELSRRRQHLKTQPADGKDVS